MYVGDFITKIRQRTGKTRYSIDASGNPTEGIPQTLVIDFINEAKDFIQAAIVSTGSLICDSKEEISIVSGTSDYSVVGPVHLGNKIRNIQYSFSGQTRDYRDFPRLRDEQRTNIPCSVAYGYISRGTQISIIPPPSQSGAKIRPEYPRQWDVVNLRAGKVTSKAGGPPSTSILLNNDAYLDAVALGTAQQICLVDLYGTVLDYNVSVTSYNSSTRTLTIPATTLVGSTGAFVVVGRYATTDTDVIPSSLILQYIKIESQMRMFDQSSSIDAIRESSFLGKIYSAVIEGYQDEILDDTDIPINDPYAMS